MKASLIFLCLVIAVAAPLSESTPQSFCGRALAETLFIFCNNAEFDQYRDPALMQKGETAPPEMEMGKETVMSPIAMQHMKPNYERLSGVVHECCLKPCTISKFLSYC